MAASKPTQVTVRATDVQRKFSQLLKSVFSEKRHVIVEKGGLKVAVILPISEYEALMQVRDRSEQERSERLGRFRRAARAIGEEVERLGLTEEEMEQLVEETRQQLYEEKCGKEPAE
jgi:prevent-host-death family protein